MLRIRTLDGFGDSDSSFNSQHKTQQAMLEKFEAANEKAWKTCNSLLKSIAIHSMSSTDLKIEVTPHPLKNLTSLINDPITFPV